MTEGVKQPGYNDGPHQFTWTRDIHINAPSEANIRIASRGLHHDNTGQRTSNTSGVESRSNIYRPLLNYMMLFGVAYEENDKWPWKLSLSKLYHWFVMVLIWGNVVRYFSAYGYYEPLGFGLLSKLMIHMTYILSALSVATGYILNRRRNSMMQDLTNYQRRYPTSVSRNTPAKHRTRCKVIIVITTIAILSIAGTMTSEAWTSSESILLKLQLLPFTSLCDRLPLPVYLSVLVIVLELYVAISVMLVLALLCLLVLNLRDEFMALTAEMMDAMSPSVTSMETAQLDIETWRQRHLDITHIVLKIDGIFGLYILTVFVISIPTACFVIYICFMLRMPIEMAADIYLILFPILLTCVVIMLVVITVGTMLSTAALAPRNFMYRLNLSGTHWDIPKSLQLQTFYGMLAEGNIGISGWKLFYINKLTVKMVILIIISYSVMLLKFGKPIDFESICGFPVNEIATTEMPASLLLNETIME